MPRRSSRHLELAIAVACAIAVGATSCGGTTLTGHDTGAGAVRRLPLPAAISQPAATTTRPPTTRGATAPKRRAVTRPKPPPTDPTSGLAIAPALSRPWAEHFTAADAVVGRVALYASPGQPVPTGASLPNPTVEGLPLVFLVRQATPHWLRVQIQSRPNGAIAWVRRTDVATRSVPDHIVIERQARRITLFHGDQPILQDVAAVGKASSPTPLGTFFVDGIVKLANPNGAYGAYQVSFTGFSDVYQHFGSGIGQVAMHGTNEPALLGTPASHGCVRLSNDTVTRLAPLAPTGTPVEVVP